MSTHAYAPSRPGPRPTASGLVVQRQCACGGKAGSLSGECEDCRKKKLQRKPLHVGAPDDRHELEADRVADAVVAGRRPPTVSGALPSIQRDGPPADKTDDEKLTEALKKIGEAFLETPAGKEILGRIKDDKLVRGAAGFASTLPGKIIVGSAAGGAVAALAATHKPLPAQLPEIPFDSIKPGLAPGLSVQITWEGPVDRPTSAMISFKYTEQPAGHGQRGSPAPSASERTRAGTAALAADLARFRAGLRYPPGSPEDLQQKAEQAAMQDALRRVAPGPDLDAMVRQYPWLATPPAGNGPRLTLPPASLGYRPRQPSLGDGLRLTPPAQADKKPDDAPVQRKADHPGASAGPAPASVHETLDSAGQPLDAGTRNFMESRLGHDFSRVRIHTDSRAAASARAVDAAAYTAGEHIAFAAGKLAPETLEGRRLLAHELTHVIQQEASPAPLQRAPALGPAPPDKAAEASKVETQILSSSAYTKLAKESQDRVRWIIAQARAKPLGDAKGQRNYYLAKLETALTTPFVGKESGKAEYGCSPDAEKENLKEVDEALQIEKMWGGAFSDLDENVVAGGTQKVTRKGQGGKTFLVDRSDARKIRVKMKVKLNGKPTEVAKITQLEDAIERAVSMSTKGYYLDIEFVNAAGPDVFEFTVSFCEWANSGNWASGPVTLSHEVHHALGLDDRYDYIESHSGNTKMNVPMRLVWFAEQMKKTGGPRDTFSKMDTSSNPLLAEDVCAVAFDAGPDLDKCVQTRKDLDPANVPAI